jgi:hypothetical protein
VDNSVDGEWCLIDTHCGNLALFEIQHCIQKMWLCVNEEKRIMGNQVIEDWDVLEYVKSKGELQDEEFTFYREADRHSAKSFLHAKNIINRRMVAKFGKRWKEK